MPPVREVREFDPADLDLAASALARRHRRDREHFPILPPRFADPSACREILAAATTNAEGVAAHRSGALDGFLFGADVLPAPGSPSARFAPERGTMMFAHGHSLADGADASETYGALYAALAARWVRRGLLDHAVHVPAEDPALAAWANLGFGGSAAVAARDLAPVAAGRIGKVQVRRAAPEDLDTVDRLVLEESRYHAGAPIFRPFLARDTAAQVHEAHRQALADEGQAIFIARERRADVGILCIGPGLGSPLFIPDRAAYVGATAVLPEARGSGVGAALVDAALAWAREREYRAVTLHFATANPLSRPFWTDLGFRTVMWHLRRRLDDRITWARPPDDV